MGEKGSAKRNRIIAAADTLFYEQGYNLTSFSDIAEAAGLPRGNFYYYFRSKEEILAAVIDHRLQHIRVLLNDWNTTWQDPRERLKRFVQMLRNSADELMRLGCPIGSLSSELGKTQRPLQSQARAMLDLFRDWIAEQLAALGMTEPDIETCALHLITVGQGISLVASVYQDRTMLTREATALDDWIDALGATDARAQGTSR